MKKFKYPLAIRGTLLDPIVQKLFELGYREGTNKGLKWTGDSDQYLVTDFSDGTIGFSLGSLAFVGGPDADGRGVRTILHSSNQDLVLALAAMVDDDQPYVGEYWIGIPNTEMGGFHSEIFRIESINNEKVCTDKPSPREYIHISWFLDSSPRNNGGMSLRKATKEEILDYFNQKKADDLMYKLNAEFIDSHAKQPIAYLVITQILAWPYGTLLRKGLDNHWYPEKTAGSPLVQKFLSDTSLLDDVRLFKPIYAEEPKVIKVLMHSASDNFELEVSKDGIYYRKDENWLSIQDIQDVVRLEKNVQRGYEVGNSGKVYTFTPSHFDCGCKRMVPRNDWIIVLSKYYELQK